MANEFFTGLLRWQSDTSLLLKNGLAKATLFIVYSLLSWMLLVIILAPTHGLYNLSVAGIANLINATQAPFVHKNIHYYNTSGTLITAPIATVGESKEIQNNTHKMEKIITLSGLLGLGSGAILLYLTVTFIVTKQNEKKDKKSFIRGGELVDDVALVERIKERGEVSSLWLGEVPYITSKLPTHLGVFGDTGTGKSQLLFGLLDTLREQNNKLLIVDKSGEFVQHYYRPETDVILGPFDDRTHNWTPFFEGKELFDCERLAKSFIPSVSGNTGKDDHWPEASVTVFSWLLYKLGKEKNNSIDHLIKQLTFAENVVVRDELDNDKIVKLRGVNKLLKGTLAELVVDPDSPEHAASVLASIIPKIRALWYLRGLDDKPRFSFREWVQDDKPGCVFIRITEDQLDSVNSVVTAWIDTVIKTVLSLEKNDGRELWAFIDELQSFEKINSLRKGIFEGRKYGLRLVLGFTSILELYSLYGQHSVKAMMSMLGTKAVFRTSEPDAAEWNSRMLGDEEIRAEDLRTNIGSGHNLSVGDQRQRHSLVSATELGSLPNLSFYLKFAGDWPVTKTRLDFKERPTVAAPMVPRVIPDGDEHEAAASPGANLYQRQELEDSPLI